LPLSLEFGAAAAAAVCVDIGGLGGSGGGGLEGGGCLPDPGNLPVSDGVLGGGGGSFGLDEEGPVVVVAIW